MTNRLPKLVLAAALLSSIPLAASADGRDGERDGAPPAGWSAPRADAPPPWDPRAYPADPDRPGAERHAWREDGWREHGWREGEWRERGWREHEWRERDIAELSSRLRALDAERDWFYAENRFRPGRLRRSDRSWLERREELERRLPDLRVAWR